MAFGIKTEVEKQSRQNTLNEFNKLINEMKKISSDNPIGFKIDNINKTFDNFKNNLNESNNSAKALGGSFAGITSHFLKLVGIAETFRFTMDKIKDGISFINSVNKQSTNIRMVTGMSEDEMNSYVKSVNTMAIQLKDDTNNLLDSSETFLRAGRNIKDATELVQLSTMVSKVSGQIQATTSEQMIQVQNGWKMTNAELKVALDGLSALDQKSSSSLAEIITGLGRTSASAEEAGEKFNDLAAYITVVSDVSKKSASTIGESFRSVYARMTNLKLGKLDEEGAAISDVEKALHKVNINLRENETTFRSMGDVIKDVMKNWNGWNDIERNMVANAIASSRQKENFIILMNNQAKIQDYLNYQTESAGTIQQQYNVYLESTEGRMNQLKSTSQRFWLQILDSNVIKGAIGGLTRIVEALEWMITKGKALGITLVALTAEFIALSKGVELVSLAFKALQGFSIISMLANPLFLVGAAIAGAVVAIGAFSRASAKAREDIEKTKKATDDLSESMKNFDKAGMESGIKALEEKENKLKDITKKMKDLKDELTNKATEEVQRKYGGGDVEGKILNQIHTLEANLNKETKALKDSGLAIDENTYSIVQLTEAKDRLGQINTVENIKKEAEAEWNNRQAISALYAEYQNLISAENQSATVKTRLSQVSNELKDKVKGVTTAMNDDGVVRVENISLVGQQIDSFNKENLTLKGLTETRLNDYRNHLASEKMKTQTTYAEVKARVQMLSKEYEAAMDNINPKMNFLSSKWKYGIITDTERAELENLQKGAMYTSSMFTGAIEKTKGVISEIDAIFKSGGASLDIPTPSISNPPKINDSGKEKKDKKDSEALDIRIEKTNKWKQQLEQVDIQMSKINKKIELEKDDNKKVELLREQIKLTTQKSDLNDKIYNQDLESLVNSKKLLQDLGFKFNEQTGIIENEDLLLQKQAYANSLKGETREKEQKHVQNISKEINDVYYKLFNNTQKNREQWEELNKQASDFKDNIKDIGKSMKTEILDELDKIYEKTLFGNEGLDAYERNAKDRVDSKQAEIDVLQKRWELEKQDEEYLDKVKEIEKVKQQLSLMDLENLSKLSEKKARELGLEQEREKILQHNTELVELELKLKNLNEQKNIQTLTQKDGRWQFDYVADTKEIEKVNNDIKKKKDDLNKYIKDNTSKLHEDLKNKEEDLRKFELDIYRKLKLEQLEDEKRHIEKDLSIKKEYFESLKKLTRENWDKDNPNSITSIVETATGHMNKDTKSKFKDVIESIQNGIKGAKSQIDDLIGKINSIPSVPTVNSNPSPTSTQNSNTFSQLTGDLEHDKAILDKIQRFDTGGMAHVNNSNGGVAIVDDKELILNQNDSKNMLDSIKISKELIESVQGVDFINAVRSANVTQSIMSELSGYVEKIKINESKVNNNNGNITYRIDNVTMKLDVKDLETADKAMNTLEQAFRGLRTRAIQSAKSKA